MKSSGRLVLVILSVILMTVSFLAACDGDNDETSSELESTPVTSPLEARVGEWSGAMEFGSFTFVVSANGLEITDFTLEYEVAIISGSIAPEGEIAITIKEDGSFILIDVEEQQLLFHGQFSDDGQRVTGVWEMNIPMVGFVSGEWEVER